MSDKKKKFIPNKRVTTSDRSKASDRPTTNSRSGTSNRPTTNSRPGTSNRPTTNSRPGTSNRPTTNSRPGTSNRPTTNSRPMTIKGRPPINDRFIANRKTGTNNKITSNDKTKSSNRFTRMDKTLFKKKGPTKTNNSKSHKVRIKRVEFRLLIVGFIFGSILLGLLARVGYIALVKGDEYEREVYTRMVSTEKDIKALRGQIVDINHKVIANSELVYHIIMDPVALLDVILREESRQKTYTVLAEYLETTPEEIAQIAQDFSKSRYKIMKKNISAEDMEMLKAENLQGIWFEESFIRTYPRESLAAQVLGFYNGTQGQYGVEQFYDHYLQGINGRIFPTIQDGNIMITDVVAAQTGKTVVLTIDEVVQQYVEQVMDEYVKEYNPLNAAAMVMNPNTGEIYAMYNSPGFNPNNYANLSEQMGEEAWMALESEEKSAALGRAWTNFNTQHPYEPGSTFKPMVMSAAIEEEILDGTEVYNCTGSNFVADANIQCWKRTGHGFQTLEQAIANSCNTVMIQMAEDMPTEIFYDYMVKFGLGEPTNIDLPAESRGLIHALGNLGPVEKATSSIGQGFTLTTMQLMAGFSSVINGGDLITPYIVSQVIDSEGKIMFENQTDIKRQVISEETSDILREYMESTITYGTGTAAAIDGYHIGGKTGTAQKLPREDNEHIYSFVGYAPLENPEVIVLTLFDEIEEETGVPTRAFAEIMNNVLPYLGIETSQTPTKVETGSATTPSIVDLELTRGIEHLYAEELEYEVIGVGNTIVNQYPVAGTKLPQGTTVKIYVETQNPGNVQEVPNLEGLSIQDARQAVEGMFSLQGSSGGTITVQIPKAGTKIEKDSKIIVQTSQ